MTAATTRRPLADLEEDALVAVETEWQRRAKGACPWTTGEYLDRIDAVHARFANLRRHRLGRLA